MLVSYRIPPDDVQTNVALSFMSLTVSNNDKQMSWLFPAVWEVAKVAKINDFMSVHIDKKQRVDEDEGLLGPMNTIPIIKLQVDSAKQNLP